MPTADPSPDSIVIEAARNALAVASLAHRQAESTLACFLRMALKAGMDVADLCAATGLDEPYVQHLLGEGVGRS